MILFETDELFCSFWLFLKFSRFASINYCPNLLSSISCKMLYFSVHEWKIGVSIQLLKLLLLLFFTVWQNIPSSPFQFKFCHRKANMNKFYIKMNF
jgi:hypothetical protein